MGFNRTHLETNLRIARRYGIKRAVIFCKALLRERGAVQQWQAFIDSHIAPDGRDAMMLRSLLPYMRQYFTPEKRRDLLRTHTLTMAQHVVVHARLQEEPGMAVATLTGKNEAAYTLYIGGNTSKEGEMAFSIYDPSGHYMAKMEATIGPDETGAPVLWIGGLQGAKPPLGRDEVVRATRDLFGLRPKGGVMLAAQTFAQMMGLAALRAPDNVGHISQRSFRRLRNKRKIYADYGQFWEEVGGIAVAEHEYRIPITPLVRDMSEVKPHKRSEWKKRQALSEDLMAQVTAALVSIRAQ